MKVRHLLDAKGDSVYAVSSAASLAQAVHLLKHFDVGALVVLGPEQELVGVLSERDVARRLCDDGHGALEKQVSGVMTRDVVTCHPETPVTDLMALMTTERIRHVPVIDQGALVGLVSIGDVVKSRIDELEHLQRDLLEYVGAR